MKTEMATTPGFHNKNELYGSPVAKDRWMPNINHWSFSYLLYFEWIGIIAKI